MGQIGAPETAELPASQARRLLRSLFPSSAKGNLVDNDNRRVCYNKWNDGVVPAHINLATGIRGIKEIEADINAQMGGQYVRITTEEESERVSFEIVRSGVQFDFKSPGCRGLADRLGFSRNFEIPAVGLLNEVQTPSGLCSF